MRKDLSQFSDLAGPISISLLGQPTMRGEQCLRWGRKGSFVVNTGGTRAGTFHDFASNDHGDLIALVMREMGLPFRAAVAWLQEFSGKGMALSRLALPPATYAPKRWSKDAQSLWEASLPIAGTPAEDYLRSRACYVPNLRDLRFLAGTVQHPPALVARVTDFLTGEPITLHFTQFLPGTGKLGTRFLTGHQKRGGAVRLVPLVEGATSLGVAEGLETTLSVIHARRSVAWSALDAGNLGDLPCRPGFAELHVWADNDPAGARAAKMLADRYSASGRLVRVILPPGLGQDWNDVIMAGVK